MKKLKPYIDKLRDELITHNLYHPKNEMMIANVAQARYLVDKAFDELKGQRVMLYQTGSRGQTKISLNPLFDQIRQMIATAIRGEAKLGLGNNTTQEAETEAETETELDKFLKELQ